MATVPAWEVPILREADEPQPESDYLPRHRKPFSALSVRLSDDLARMWERTGLQQPHTPRHRAEVDQ